MFDPDSVKNYIATFQTVLRFFSFSLLALGLGPEPEQDPHPDTGLQDPGSVNLQIPGHCWWWHTNVFF
jgi:hypothetical protein